MVDPAGEGLDGAVGGACAFGVDALSFGAILLVGDLKSAFNGPQEGVQGGSVWNGSAAAVTEGDVPESEGHCEFLPVGGLPGVFANSEEVVECNVDEVGQGLGFGLVAACDFASLVQDVRCNGDGDGQLWSCGRIPFVGFYLSFEAGVVELSGLVPVDGVGAIVQFEGLADGAKRVLNRANSDLMASSCSSLTYEVGKTSEEVNSAAKGDPIEKRVHSSSFAEGGPMCPISQLDLGSLTHDPIG